MNVTKLLLSGVLVAALWSPLPPAAEPASAQPPVAGQPPASSAKPLTPAWPMANGPTGNFHPARTGQALLEDLSQARLLWTSEADVGLAKGSASGYLRMIARTPTYPGSCSGPIVADGRVFVSTFRPSGEVWAENLPHLKNLQSAFPEAESAKLRENLRVVADDMLVSMDFATGKTLWLAVETGAGVNRYMGKREGFGVGPVVIGDRVFSMGTTGRLYAYETATGKKIWQTDIGPAHTSAEASKAAALVGKTLARGFFGWDASLVAADGVLIVPMFDSGVDMGLRGVEAATGKTLWQLPNVCSRYATPAVWSHADRQYVLVANRKGELRLVDPRDGKVRWTVTGLAPTYFALSPSADTVMVNVGSATGSSMGEKYGLLAAYRITSDRAERAWTMPDDTRYWFENHMDICAMRRVLIRDGRVWFMSQNKSTGSTERLLWVLDERTGEPLNAGFAIAGNSSCMMLVEDRLLHWLDASHGERGTLELLSTDPKNIRRLGEIWKPPFSTTTGYEVFMETPFVDGRLLLRHEDGRVRCYDLRRPPAGSKTPPTERSPEP